MCGLCGWRRRAGDRGSGASPLPSMLGALIVHSVVAVATAAANGTTRRSDFLRAPHVSAEYSCSISAWMNCSVLDSGIEVRGVRLVVWGMRCGFEAFRVKGLGCRVQSESVGSVM